MQEFEIERGLIKAKFLYKCPGSLRGIFYVPQHL